MLCQTQQPGRAQNQLGLAQGPAGGQGYRPGHAQGGEVGGKIQGGAAVLGQIPGPVAPVFCAHGFSLL